MASGKVPRRLLARALTSRVTIGEAAAEGAGYTGRCPGGPGGGRWRREGVGAAAAVPAGVCGPSAGAGALERGAAARGAAATVAPGPEGACGLPGPPSPSSGRAGGASGAEARSGAGPPSRPASPGTAAAGGRGGPAAGGGPGRVRGVPRYVAAGCRGCPAAVGVRHGRPALQGVPGAGGRRCVREGRPYRGCPGCCGGPGVPVSGVPVSSGSGRGGVVVGPGNPHAWGARRGALPSCGGGPLRSGGGVRGAGGQLEWCAVGGVLLCVEGGLYGEGYFQPPPPPFWPLGCWRGIRARSSRALGAAGQSWAGGAVPGLGGSREVRTEARHP